MTKSRLSNSFINSLSLPDLLVEFRQTEGRNPMGEIPLPRPHPEPPCTRHSDLFKSTGV
jgi:hypothetical protein